MIRVAALTSGLNAPSARFRIRQNIDPLGRYGIEVREYCPPINQHMHLPGSIWKIRHRFLPPILITQMILNAGGRIPGIAGSYDSDLTWIERYFLPGLEFLVKLTQSPRILDVDDAIWLCTLLGEKFAKVLAKNVDAVIAGNSFIADWYSNYCKKVYVLPTGIDCNRFNPIDRRVHKRLSHMFVIGWIGTSGNFKYLDLIQRPLARFLKDHPDSLFLVDAERQPSLKLISKEQFYFRPWSPEDEVSVLHQMDVGIMPLADDDWSRGKCGFKMLQYMSSALPVVVSPVGMNNDVLKKEECGFAAKTESEWYEALSTLYSNPTIREELGKAGRRIVESNYSTIIISQNLAKIFFDILNV